MSNSTLNDRDFENTSTGASTPERRGLGHAHPAEHFQHAHGHAHDAANGMRSRISSRTLWFGSQRVLPAALKLMWGAACGGLGGFLLTQMSTTPGLVTQLALLGTLGIVACIILTVLAARELLGRIVVSSEGIELKAMGGFHVAWNDLARWDLSPEDSLVPSYQQLLLYQQGRHLPHVLNVAWLSRQDRDWLRQTLSTAAPRA